MPVCDVCGNPVELEGAYALTTRQVVCCENYWKYYLSHQLKALHLIEPKGGPGLIMAVTQQAAQSTGWLVCDGCTGLFQFDRALAKTYASVGKSPPDAGPVNVGEVGQFASAAWKILYGSLPKILSQDRPTAIRGFVDSLTQGKGVGVKHTESIGTANDKTSSVKPFSKTRRWWEFWKGAAEPLSDPQVAVDWGEDVAKVHAILGQGTTPLKTLKAFRLCGFESKGIDEKAGCMNLHSRRARIGIWFEGDGSKKIWQVVYLDEATQKAVMLMHEGRLICRPMN